MTLSFVPILRLYRLSPLWGLALPLVLGLMVLRCAMEKDSQPATGLLYVMEICVLFGELFSEVEFG